MRERFLFDKWRVDRGGTALLPMWRRRRYVTFPAQAPKPALAEPVLGGTQKFIGGHDEAACRERRVKIGVGGEANLSKVLFNFLG